MTFGIHLDNEDVLPEIVIEHNNKIITLRDWQKRALDFFSENNNCIFEVVTGAGKTFIGIEIIKQVWKLEKKQTRVLIVVPKNVIMETGWYKELVDAGIPIQDIGVYYGNIKEYATITITNMQNLEKIAMDMFDFVIWDEVHNAGTKRLLEFVAIPSKYKLGLTATIDRMDGAHYDLYKIFNYNIFKYSPEEALNDDVLNNFDYRDVGIVMDSDSFETYEELTQQINFILMQGGGYNQIMISNDGMKMKMLSKMNERKSLVNNYPFKFDVVKQIVEKHKNDKIIIFNQFNEQTNKLYWHLLDIGVSSRIFHSGVEKSERDRILIDFKNDKFNVLLTTKVLDEGYNLPKIDTAIIMAGDSTPKQTIQRMGRVLRKKDKRSVLYQVYCVGTIEQQQSEKRAELFKALASNYIEYVFREGEKVEI